MIYTLTDNKRDIQQAPEYVFTPGDIVVVGNQPGPLIFESLAAFSNIGWVTNMDSDSVEGCPEDTALNGFYARQDGREFEGHRGAWEGLRQSGKRDPHD